jgi:hypothetical protein
LRSEQDFNSACSKSVFAEAFARHFMIVTHASDVARLVREHVAAVEMLW